MTTIYKGLRLGFLAGLLLSFLINCSLTLLFVAINFDLAFGVFLQGIGIGVIPASVVGAVTGGVLALIVISARKISMFEQRTGLRYTLAILPGLALLFFGFYQFCQNAPWWVFAPFLVYSIAMVWLGTTLEAEYKAA